MIDVIGFDADDTLWHSESYYAVTQERFRELLSDHADPADLSRHLYEVEMRNLEVFGYGAKGFTLSLIETAVEITDGRVSAEAIQQIVGWGKEMMRHPVELLEGVDETLASLHGDYRLALVTKGDLLHQESKVAQSGLGDLFELVEVVSMKDPETYRRVLGRLGTPPGRFLMVGNSMRSDVEPVVRIGGRAVHIPYHTTWDHEVGEPPEDVSGFWELDDIRELPDLLERLGSDRR